MNRQRERTPRALSFGPKIIEKDVDGLECIDCEDVADLVVGGGRLGGSRINLRGEFH